MFYTKSQMIFTLNHLKAMFHIQISKNLNKHESTFAFCVFEQRIKNLNECPSKLPHFVQNVNQKEIYPLVKNHLILLQKQVIKDLPQIERYRRKQIANHFEMLHKDLIFHIPSEKFIQIFHQFCVKIRIKRILFHLLRVDFHDYIVHEFVRIVSLFVNRAFVEHVVDHQVTQSVRNRPSESFSDLRIVKIIQFVIKLVIAIWLKWGFSIFNGVDLSDVVIWDERTIFGEKLAQGLVWFVIFDFLSDFFTSGQDLNCKLFFWGFVRIRFHCKLVKFKT